MNFILDIIKIINYPIRILNDKYEFDFYDFSEQEFQKGDQARIWDVLFLSPFLIYCSYLIPDEYKWSKKLLFISGLYTGTYNLENYLKNQLEKPPPDNIIHY